MRRLPDSNYKLAPSIVALVPWFRETVLEWFGQRGRTFPWRDANRTPYEVVVAEVLLQRTTATNIAKIYPAFIKQYPTWASLAQAELEDLQVALKPAGLWQQKALVFQALARAMDLQGGVVPSSRLELESLAGVGQYIASAVLTTLYNQAEPFIDVNMSRVLERFFDPRKLADIRDDPYLQTLARQVVKSDKSILVNWAIIDFAALVCKPNHPLCQICPLQSKCLFFLNHHTVIASSGVR